MAIDDVIDRHAEFARENSQLLHLSKQGLQWISRQPAAMLAVDNWERVTEKYDEEKAKIRREQAQLAAASVTPEVHAGFPLLHAHATVSSWSMLESCVESVILEWLLANPRALQTDSVSKIKIELGQYEGLDPDQRMRYIIDEIKRSTKADLKIGAGRFEAILDALEIKTSISQDLKKKLMELSQIRNILVHKAGIADRRLVESCPWLRFEIGQRVRVDYPMYKEIEAAVPEYVGTVVRRLKERTAALEAKAAKPNDA
jgi:hypothetical protein